MINHIQNKSFCLHNICVCCVYLLCLYKNTHMHIFGIYLRNKKVVYILNIFIYNINYMNINTDM